MMTRIKKHKPQINEWLMIFAGVLMLVSVPVLWTTENFTLWLYAKVLFVAGIVAMLIEGARFSRH